MNKRIACIALFENKDLEKIKNLVSVLNEKLNKVPLHIEDRENVDTLPYHVSFSAWDIKEKDNILELFKTISMKAITLEVNDVKIKEGFSGGYNLYLSTKENKNFFEIQKYIYDKLPNERFNPNKYTIHISLHLDNDYNKLVEMQEILLKSFKSFEISFSELGLFEIYPAKMVL